MTLAFRSTHWLKGHTSYSMYTILSNFPGIYDLRMLFLRLLPMYGLENDIMRTGQMLSERFLHYARRWRLSGLTIQSEA